MLSGGIKFISLLRLVTSPLLLLLVVDATCLQFDWSAFVTPANRLVALVEILVAAPQPSAKLVEHRSHLYTWCTWNTRMNTGTNVVHGSPFAGSADPFLQLVR